MMNVLVTHVKHYTVPGTLPALLRQKMHAICHDASFGDQYAALSFEKANTGPTETLRAIFEALMLYQCPCRFHVSIVN